MPGSNSLVSYQYSVLFNMYHLLAWRNHGWKSCKLQSDPKANSTTTLKFYPHLVQNKKRRNGKKPSGIS